MSERVTFFALCALVGIFSDTLVEAVLAGGVVGVAGAAWFGYRRKSGDTP